ncbi:hypothetical protein K501DRAFT_186704 [Backusella circina FSU 941]|nr:hypothetical protein K501DRAFT_186704 [Backusella circina FSU 941]
MSTIIPPPLGLGRPSQRSKRYKLVIVQNPIRARCCGFGEKDRRPVDPPPILQLFIEQPNGELRNAIEDADNASLFVVQCSLFSQDGKEQRNHVFNPSSLQNLSVRVEGRFRLRFAFMNLSVGDPLTMSTQVSNEVISDPFTIYSAKNFPGMTDSTSISQTFAHQGIKISIRKGRRVHPITPVNRAYPNNDDELNPVQEGNSDQIPAAPQSHNSNDVGDRRPYRRIEIASFLLP